MISATIKETPVHVGDTVRVKTTVVEGSKTRVQAFEGIILSLRGRAENKTFTVRRIGNRQIGVERTWPLDSRSIVALEVVKNAKKVRRSKLYFLRNLTGKAASQI
jgi:large subunit ribosomal protein L19